MKPASTLRRGARLTFWLALTFAGAGHAQAALAAKEVVPAPAAVPAVAATPEEATRPGDDFVASSWSDSKAADDSGFGWVLLRTLVVLGMVVALIYVTLNFGLRRLMGIKGLPGGRSSVVTLLERLPLDQKRALFVVKAAGEYLLVGGGDGTLQLIAKLDPVEVERLQREKPAPLALSPLLQKLLARRGGPPPPTP